MKDIAQFSANVVAKFENDYENMVQFNALAKDASHRVYTKYSKEETNEILRKQFSNIMGCDWKTAKPMQRRQSWRQHGPEVCSLIEETLLDRMNSGWNAENAKFMNLVREVNLAEDDKASFHVPDTSLLQVSKYAGNHHDIVRQKVLPGKSFDIETSPYVVKVYADFEAFQLGRVDFADMVDRMYKSIEQFRYSALYTAFMSLDQSLPSDMKFDLPITEAGKIDIVEAIEAVKAATGKDVILVGTRVAIAKLQSTVAYNIYSNEMKNEINKNGIMAFWEGYECLALDRVNASGTRDSVFSDDDNKKIYIIPVDDEFRPIVRVNEGDVVYFERGMDGTLQDMTVEAEIWYREGIGIVINELFGVIVADE